MQIESFDSHDEFMSHLERIRENAKKSLKYLHPYQKEAGPGTCYMQFIPEIETVVFGYSFTKQENIDNELAYKDEYGPSEEEIAAKFEDDLEHGYTYSLAFSQGVQPELGSVHLTRILTTIDKPTCMMLAKLYGFEEEFKRWLSTAYTGKESEWEKPKATNCPWCGGEISDDSSQSSEYGNGPDGEPLKVCGTCSQSEKEIARSGKRVFYSTPINSDIAEYPEGSITKDQIFGFTLVAAENGTEARKLLGEHFETIPNASAKFGLVADPDTAAFSGVAPYGAVAFINLPKEGN